MLVWNDIAKYTKDYNNGIKKLDDAVSDANNLQKEKLNHKTNQFKLHSLTDDYGLNDKVTIRPMKFKYDKYRIFVLKQKSFNILKNLSKRKFFYEKLLVFYKKYLKVLFSLS